MDFSIYVLRTETHSISTSIPARLVQGRGRKIVFETDVWLSNNLGSLYCALRTTPEGERELCEFELTSNPPPKPPYIYTAKLGRKLPPPANWQEEQKEVEGQMGEAEQEKSGEKPNGSKTGTFGDTSK